MGPSQQTHCPADIPVQVLMGEATAPWRFPEACVCELGRETSPGKHRWMVRQGRLVYRQIYKAEAQ